MKLNIKNIKTVACIIFLIGITSCVELYEPEIGEYESSLVVDAVLSDQAASSQVKLTESFNYNEASGEPISGAAVIAEDDQGGLFEFEEDAPGIYLLNPDIYEGVIGRNYRLTILLSNGASYASDWEEMKASPDISSIEYEVSQKLQDIPGSLPVPTVNLYVNTEDPSNQTKYYKWSWVETYEFAITSPSRIEVDFQGDATGSSAIVRRLPFDEFEGNRCYKSEDSEGIIIATTENLNENKIARMPIHSFNNMSPKIAFKYSILVKQQVISKKYFLFLKKVQEINQGTGSLFDPIPNEVFGNIKSTNESTRPVLGYFGVGGVEEKRLFINRAEIPKEFAPIRGPECKSDTIPLELSCLYQRTVNGSQVLADYYNVVGLGNIGFILSSPPCNECIATNSSNIKPIFW